jgi:hypothetical protein
MKKNLKSKTLLTWVPLSQLMTVPVPKPQVLAAVADAQPVEFSAVASQQQSCPEVAEMLPSSNLQITSQTVGGAYLLGDVLTFQDRSGRGHH